MEKSAVVLSAPQRQFLEHVFETYCRNGFPSDQLPIAASTYQALKNPQRIVPESVNLGPVDVVGIGPNHLDLQQKPSDLG